MNSDKQKKKNVIFPYIILIIVLLAGVIGIIYWLLVSKSSVEYQSFFVRDIIAPYVQGSTMSLKNNLAIIRDKSSINTFYGAPGIDTNKVREGAQKLGLSNEDYKENQQLFLWYKEDDELSDYVALNLKTGVVDLWYDGGVNVEPINPDDAYSYLADIFGLSSKNVNLLSTTKSSENNLVLYYGFKFNERRVFFNQASEYMATITIIDGKITNALFYAFPNEDEYVEQGQLRPLTSISPNILMNAVYTGTIVPDRVLSAERTGFLASPPESIDINLTSEVDVYYYYVDESTGRFYLLPSIEATGKYIDNENGTGLIKLIIIDQEL